MRRLCILGLLAFSSAAWGADGPAFHLRAPVPGSTVTVTSSFVAELAFHGPWEGKAIKMRKSRAYDMEILANDKTVTKVRVHYLVAEDTTESEGQIDRQALPIAGKTYVITSAASGVEILGEGGKAPAKEELDLLKEFDSLGKREGICVALDGKRLKAGEEVDPHLLASVLGSLMDVKMLDSAFLQLREIHTRSDGSLAGLFDHKLKTTNTTEEGTQGTFSGTGTLEIALDPCLVLNTEIAGPMSLAVVVESNGQKISIQGTGTNQISMQAQYK